MLRPGISFSRKFYRHAFSERFFITFFSKALKKKKQNKKKTVVSLAPGVALQGWYGIPNERVPKSPLNSG